MLTFLAAAIALSLSVLVHEFGHFVLGKFLGARVLKFSVGLGPRIFGIKRGETDYCVSWVPFGGYVKFAGMEEGKNVENAFVDMAIWRRGLIMFSGPLFNLLLAFVIFCAVVYVFGVGVIKTTTVGRVYPESPAAAAGIVIGDSVISVAGKSVVHWGDVAEELQKSRGERVTVHVVRAGRELALKAVPAFNDTFGVWQLGMEPAIGTEVGEVMKDSPAYRAGLRPGDVVTSIDGKPVAMWDDMVALIHGSPGKKIAITWLRTGKEMRAEVVPKSQMVLEGSKARKVGMIGILMPFARKRLTVAGSVVEGSMRTWFTFNRIVLFVFQLFARRVSPSLIGGPAAIAQLAGESLRWGQEFFLGFFGFLSVNLFVLNLIPLPPLDGGQLVFLAFEGVRRRPVSRMARLVFAQIGIILLVLAMIYVTFNDLMRWSSR
ncbi:MAG: RIP metalloprotease RseP [bacterium]